jgi:DNA-binding transcriptional regulator YdaS (Cro superfamily)
MRAMRIVDPTTSLKAAVQKHGSQKAAAKALGVCETTLSAILLGRRDVPRTLAARLGLEKKIVFVQKAS